MILSLTIPGPPVPQGAIKTFIAGGRAHGRHSNARELQDYRARIAMAAQEIMRDEEPHDGPVEITVSFFVTRPKGHLGQGRNAGMLKPSAPRFPITRPDLSHLIRAFEDGLSGVVLRDDSLIVRLTAEKAYAARPRTEATIEFLTARAGTEQREAVS